MLGQVRGEVEAGEVSRLLGTVSMGAQENVDPEVGVLPQFSCSVIVPCRNEAGNVNGVVSRIPHMGRHVELVFIDDGSSDGTADRIETLIAAHPERDIKLVRRTGAGCKAAAVYHGFDAASGEVLMILDADMTVMPEDLPRFYEPLASGRADFVNGSRFHTPMEAGAMPLANRLGNQAYGKIMSWIMGTSITDALCGTKVLFKHDWPRLSAVLPLFGGYDRWGDFDLLLAAAYCGLRIEEVQVRYGARRQGESKMRPFHHGLALGRTCLVGARHLRFGHRAG